MNVYAFAGICRLKPTALYTIKAMISIIEPKEIPRTRPEMVGFYLKPWSVCPTENGS